MKNLIIVTGGAGFVGSNLIKFLLKETSKKIISLDNYSSGNKKNHHKNKNVKYLKGDTFYIANYLKKEKKKFIQFFISGNLQESIKVLKNLMNVSSQILLAQMQYLNFALIITSNLSIQQPLHH